MGYSKLHFAEGCTGVREHLSLNVKVQAFLLPRTSPAGTKATFRLRAEWNAPPDARVSPPARAGKLLKILPGGDDRSGQNDHTGPPPRYGFWDNLKQAVPINPPVVFPPIPLGTRQSIAAVAFPAATVDNRSAGIPLAGPHPG